MAASPNPHRAHALAHYASMAAEAGRLRRPDQPLISIPGGIYLDTSPGAEVAYGHPYRFFPGPLRDLGLYLPVAAHTITVDLPDVQPLPVPEVTDSDFGAFQAAGAAL